MINTSNLTNNKIYLLNEKLSELEFSKNKIFFEGLNDSYNNISNELFEAIHNAYGSLLNLYFEIKNKALNYTDGYIILGVDIYHNLKIIHKSQLDEYKLLLPLIIIDLNTNYLKDKIQYIINEFNLINWKYVSRIYDNMDLSTLY